MPRKAPAADKSNRAKRRAEIARGLYDCILKQGYLNTTVRDIALEAKLNTGLIHHYFESKEEILYFLMEKIVTNLKNNIPQVRKKHVQYEPRERLKKNIEYLFKKLSRDKEVYIIFYELFNLARQHANLNDLLKSIYRDFRLEVENFITDSFQELGIPVDENKTVAAFLVSACEGAGAQWMIDPRSISIPKITDMADLYIDLYLNHRKG